MKVKNGCYCHQSLNLSPKFEFIILFQVNYYMDDLEVLQNKPLHMAQATFINNDDEEHTITQTLTYSKTRCVMRDSLLLLLYLKFTNSVSVSKDLILKVNF